MEPERPDPEQLLRQVTEQTKKRGKLKIFFGACAGAGKTYAMLSAAQEELRQGEDILVGLVETHGRTETARLLEGLNKLPLKHIEYQGITLKEFDLESALKRKPGIILVDELAHTNAISSIHPKRWQDVNELLDAGINVYTTLNVQHIESLNDVVAEFTGIRVKETVPDSIFDNADEIVLVDLPSEVIIERLHEGKVYLGEFAKQRAAQHFFKMENLIALREIALRRTAERVDALRDIYKKLQPKDKSAIISDKILVCIGPKAISTKLIRSAKQQATKLKAPWTAIYVESEQEPLRSSEEQKFIEKTLRLAEQLGGKVKRLHNPDISKAIIQFAHENGYTKIIIGKSTTPRWKRQVFFSCSLVNDILDKATIDVYVINEDKSQVKVKRSAVKKWPWIAYLIATLIIVCCTVIGFALRGLIPSENMIMIYLIGVVAISTRSSRAIAIYATILTFVFYKYFFTYPYYSFHSHNVYEITTSVLLLLTGLYVSIKTSHLHLQTQFAREREEFNDELYELTRKLIVTPGKPKIAKVVSQHIGEHYESAVTVWIPDGNGVLQLASHPGVEKDPKELSVAQWAYQHNQPAGSGTNTMPSARGYYIPLTNGEMVFGVMGIIPKDPNREFTNEEMMMLESFAIQTALALERVKNSEVPKKETK